MYIVICVCVVTICNMYIVMCSVSLVTIRIFLAIVTASSTLASDWSKVSHLEVNEPLSMVSWLPILLQLPSSVDISYVSLNYCLTQLRSYTYTDYWANTELCIGCTENTGRYTSCATLTRHSVGKKSVFFYLQPNNWPLIEIMLSFLFYQIEILYIFRIF